MRNGDSLNGIVTFVQAVDAGSFALAAERLHLTRSAVAKIIARLEERLGTRLFNRTTRTQSLTEDGQAFYERCVRALAELEAGEAALDSGRREPSGRLHVSAPVLFGRYCVAPAMRLLSERYPRLSIDMSFSDRVVDLVDEGCDLAVRIGTLPDSASLASRRIGVQTMSVCASPSYLEKHGRPGTVDELRHHRAIVYGRAGRQFPWRLHYGDGHVHNIVVDARLRFDDLQAIADAAVAGQGLAWLPCWLVSSYMQRGELEPVLDCGRAASSEIHAVWAHTRYLPAKIRCAIDILLNEVPKWLSSPAPTASAK